MVRAELVATEVVRVAAAAAAAAAATAAAAVTVHHSLGPVAPLCFPVPCPGPLPLEHGGLCSLATSSGEI